MNADLSLIFPRFKISLRGRTLEWLLLVFSMSFKSPALPYILPLSIVYAALQILWMSRLKHNNGALPLFICYLDRWISSYQCVAVINLGIIVQGGRRTTALIGSGMLVLIPALEKMDVHPRPRRRPPILLNITRKQQYLVMLLNNAIPLFLRLSLPSFPRSSVHLHPQLHGQWAFRRPISSATKRPPNA